MRQCNPYGRKSIFEWRRAGAMRQHYQFLFFYGALNKTPEARMAISKEVITSGSWICSIAMHLVIAVKEGWRSTLRVRLATRSGSLPPRFPAHALAALTRISRNP